MSEHGFDALARRSVPGVSRRSVARGMLGAVAAIVGLGTSRVTTAAPQGTVEICHRTGNRSVQRISINGNALNAHLAHGDSLIDTVVSLDASNPDPVSTGVVLAPGESVTVTVSGTTTWDAGASGYVDANGDSAYTFIGGFPVGSIVGAIGGGDIHADPSTFTLVGTGPTTLSASSGGELVLQYVDGQYPGDTAAYPDNSGTLTATISRSC